MPKSILPTSHSLVENHEKVPQFSLFEKVLLAAHRAKALHHENRKPLVEAAYSKAPLIALSEINAGMIAIKPVEEHKNTMESIEELLDSELIDDDDGALD